MGRKFSSSVALTALLCAAACASQGPSRAPAKDPESAAKMFERLKSLEGRWVQVGPEATDAPAPGIAVSYRVTSAGTAVVETVFEGAPHEMVTVYTLDNGHLMLTHYCAMGNQPQMLAEPITDPDVVSFEAVALGNATSMDDPHMHWGTLRFVPDGRLHAEWSLRSDGERHPPVKLDLERAP